MYKVQIRTTDRVVTKAFEKMGVAKTYREKVKEKYPDYKVFIFSTLKTKPPTREQQATVRKKLHRYYCPYCRAVRMFSEDKEMDLRKCVICGISDRDFHVRVFNDLFPTTDEKDVRRRKRNGKK